MFDQLNKIKTTAIEMRDTTSKNDDRREDLQNIINICNELISHFIDDGR